ncbi:uncharacterized protein LOC124360052 [Homalodisca vitripennis]|uniref:uncharacterized protein LOC124360052 n=1 Tax=Homalodisca vitripennis TaxID=197043 RepID=UPI001EEA47BD|nr:uncharacterized protein LOC124360052 [Homalodisca vitripennis]
MDTPLFWNILDIPAPVCLSVPFSCGNAKKVCGQIKFAMNQIKMKMNDLTQLDLEAATLSRLIYRSKHKHRQEKSFKALQMINRCLTNYKTMHLPFTLSSVRDTLQDNCGPTRQMMEWTLVRLYGVAHLFHRVYLLCLDAAGHLFVKVKLTHLWELTMFSLAVVSRIWTLSQYLVRLACEWYQNLYQFLDKLQPSSTPWLPEGRVLPSDLARTLNNPKYLKLKSVENPSNLLQQVDTSLPEPERAQLTKKVLSVLDNGLFDDIGESIQSKHYKRNKGLCREHTENHLVKHKKQIETEMEWKTSQKKDGCQKKNTSTPSTI